MPAVKTQTLSNAKLRESSAFGKRVNAFGGNFVVCDCRGEILLLCEGGKFDTDEALLEGFCSRRSQRGDETQQVGREVRHCLVDERFVTVVLRDDGPGERTALYGVVDIGQPCGTRKGDRDSWVLLFGQMLELFAEKFRAQLRAEQQIDMISTELAQTYEELVLLYKISTNMEIVEPDVNFLQMACDSLTDIVSVEGIAILQERVIEEQQRFILVAGSGLIDIDERMTVLLYNRLAEVMQQGKEALLDSEVDSPFVYEWPSNIRNIIVVPLCGRDKPPFDEERNSADRQLQSALMGRRACSSGRIIGMMVAVNRLDKQDFDTTDVKLFNSVASECAVFIENNRLFNDLKELFVGSLKALTRSIDAKDRYTRGHSERVAFISKWLAERLAETENLAPEQIQKIYLAGLLHDIGKVGIDESVLCKKGKLTERERSRLRMHPSIGANILSGIKQMRDVIPGVLCHHERVDGKGYPNGLKGDQIPLMGKIIGLADCFDAMTSERVYRDALNIEGTLAEIERRLGSQFDEKVGRVFINSDVYHLWDMMSQGVSTAYGADDFSRYGTEAIGALVR